MTEQVSRGEHRVMPKIDRKDVIKDPMAIQIRDIFKKLKLPFIEIDPNIGAENRIIRNAGIVVGEFRDRYFDSPSDLIKRKAKKERFEQRIKEGIMTVKDKERYSEMIKREEHFSRLRQGKLSKIETIGFITEMQEIIPATLRVVPDATEELCASCPLTVEELISLSVIHIGQKEKIIGNAIDYLARSEGVGRIVLNLLNSHILKLDQGIYEAVYNDMHVTPLTNGQI